MKNYILIVALTALHTIEAQPPLDTIYANSSKNVALFFPKPIRQAITGTTRFLFTYNREKPQHFGLLQAHPGPESNLLIVTEDGSLYSYILAYSNTLPQFNYFITNKESIGNETPLQPIPKSLINTTDSITNRVTYLRKFSDYIGNNPKRPLATNSTNDIQLQLRKPVYYGSETYLALEMSNYSGINFEIEYLAIYRISGSKKRKASLQRIPLEPIYIHNKPDTIFHGVKYHFIYVVPKFVLTEKERLQVGIHERNGSRKLQLTTSL